MRFSVRAPPNSIQLIRAPRTADGVHTELHRVARLVRRGHESTGPGHCAGPRIWSAELVIERHHARTRHAPRVFRHEFGGRWHHQRHRSAHGRVIPGTVPTLPLAAKKIPLLDRVVLEGVMAIAIADARSAPWWTACPTAPGRRAGPAGRARDMLGAARLSVTMSPSRHRGRHDPGGDDHRGREDPMTWMITVHGNSSITARFVAHHQ